MGKFCRSIILLIVVYGAFVGFAPQAKALVCFSDLQCPKFQECIGGVCVVPGPTPCETNRDCDDGVFCNGAEICSKLDECVAGTDPCAGDICVEAADECIECEIDGDCPDGVCTAGNICVECEDDLDCEEGETCEVDVCEAICPYPLEARDFDGDGNCAFSKDELKAAKTFYKDKHKAEKTDLKESQGAEKAFLKSLKEYAE